MKIETQIKQLKELINSYKITNIIIVAKNIGVFNTLNNKSKSLQTIADNLKLNANKIEPILNSLTMFGIISKDDTGYYLDEYNDVLNPDSLYNQLGYIDFAKTIMEKYNNLENVIKNDDISYRNFKNLTEQQAIEFMKGMEANAISQANFIAENYNFSNKKILDIGAGAGTYLINAVKKYKTASGKMIDLEEIVKIQQQKIKEAHLQDKIIAVSCDYNKDFPTDEKYDDVFLFAVVHQEKEENLNKLFNNIYNSLNNQGRLFLTSFFLNDDKISPKFAVEFAVEMLLNTSNGKAYTHSEIVNLLKNNNFKDIQRVDSIAGPATLYIATKK